MLFGDGRDRDTARRLLQRGPGPQSYEEHGHYVLMLFWATSWLSLVLRPLGTEKTIIIIVSLLAIEEPKVQRRKYFTGRTETNLEFTKPKPNPVYLGVKH